MSIVVGLMVDKEWARDESAEGRPIHTLVSSAPPGSPGYSSPSGDPQQSVAVISLGKKPDLCSQYG